MRAQMSFKPNRFKVKRMKSKREIKLNQILIVLASLLLLNFGWDGYKRKVEIKEYYGITKEYYGIMLNEVKKTKNRIEQKIDKIRRN